MSLLPKGFACDGDGCSVVCAFLPEEWWHPSRSEHYCPACRPSYDLRRPILRYRGRHNLSQTEFAERVGVTQNTVSAWETGRMRPTGEHREAVVVLITRELAA